MHDLQILSPDGKSRILPLKGERITLGRSSTADLCFPDDTGLSRQHLAIEREGGEWALNDLKEGGNGAYFEMHMRLGLKAQNQSRATIEIKGC